MAAPPAAPNLCHTGSLEWRASLSGDHSHAARGQELEITALVVTFEAIVPPVLSSVDIVQGGRARIPACF